MENLDKNTNGDTKPMVIKISLPTNAYFVSGIRDFTLNLIKNTTSFGAQWAFRFQSVVDELCNNAIEHGSRMGEEIHITFTNNPGESIEISVRDTGTAAKKANAKEIEAIVAERKSPNYVFKGIRGRGLSMIVSQWTDELTFQDLPGGGVEVKVKKYLKDPKLAEIAKNMDDPTHLILK